MNEINENQAFSEDVGERISSVFRNFAVNPVNQNVTDSIKSLETKILGDEEDDDYSLKDKLLDASDDINRKVGIVKRDIEASAERFNESFKKSEEAFKLLKEDTQKAICEANSEINANLDIKNGEVLARFDALTENLKTDFEKAESQYNKAYEDLRGAEDKNTKSLSNTVKAGEKAVCEAVSDCGNAVNENINRKNTELIEKLDDLFENAELQMSNNHKDLRLQQENIEKNIVNTLNTLNDKFENAGSENRQAITSEIVSLEQKISDETNTAYNGLKRLVYGLIAADAVLLAGLIAAIIIIVTQ